MKVGASIVSADLTCLREVVKDVERCGIDFYHVDVMDGHFVPNITLGPDFIANLRKITEKTIEAHLMIEYPKKYVKVFEDSGADIITLHIESKDFDEAYKSISVKKGIALNPETDLDRIEKYFGNVDIILIMTVRPGFSGQKFMEEVVPKIERLKKIKDNEKFNFEIAVDGGINSQTINKVKDYVDMVSAAKGIFSGDICNNIKILKGL